MTTKASGEEEAWLKNKSPGEGNGGAPPMRDIPSLNRNTFNKFLNQTTLQKDPQSIEAFNTTLVEVLDEFAPLRKNRVSHHLTPRGIPLMFKPPSVRRGKLNANGKELD
ncbi:hypothetical protein ElyMa_001111700 [Elysia marginata]|uniref:Uncharacterized protein n=1 Tax=Elysia marginata TaxID=1093978 RepID=A0AAV4HUW8_9GAST|nr:hypothetical protein ElyMa_001111700 [Elysia marginata]